MSHHRKRMKKIREKRVKSLQKQIEKHEEKIEKEEGRLDTTKDYWRKEIDDVFLKPQDLYLHNLPILVRE